MRRVIIHKGLFEEPPKKVHRERLTPSCDHTWLRMMWGDVYHCPRCGLNVKTKPLI